MINASAILDSLDTLHARFHAEGRVQVTQILHPKAARSLRAAVDSLDWRLVLNEGDKHFDIQPNQLASMTGRQYRQLRLAAAERAQHQFQYFFENYPVHDIYHGRGPDALPGQIRNVYEALNSQEMLSLLYRITGLPADFCDAQITRFRTGAMLNEHDDDVPGKNRLFAYTLSLADPWKASWGGTLSFLDEAGEVTQRFVPSFNTLSIFAVPTAHRVDPVNEKARGARVSVTGWYRAGAPEEFG
ncbi:MAG: 2OG-Fe(II) oxygenase [Hyphomonadaceae bacterium]|nr:2OG-Fe(II) oxygenase [Hyphomonadaceae bacterium]